MATQKIHIVPDNEGWGVKKSGKSDPESVHPTQKEAIAAGKRLAVDEEADLVVHRQDGTFRNVITFSDVEQEHNGSPDGRGSDSRSRKGAERLSAHDVVSVGSRISWQAVFAGAVVTLAIVITLGMLGLALGLTTRDTMNDRTRFYLGAAWSLVTTMIALFVGGLVLSRFTVGEDKLEAVIYGVVLWGTLFVVLSLLSALGAGLGYQALTEQAGIRYGSAPAEQASARAGLDREQVETAREEAGKWGGDDSAGAAWWTFGLLLGSLAASILGALAGAGPELVLTRVRRPTVVAART